MKRIRSFGRRKRKRRGCERKEEEGKERGGKVRGLRRVVSVYDVNKATRLAIEAGLAKVCFGEQLMSPEGVPSVCVCACDGLPQVLLHSLSSSPPLPPVLFFSCPCPSSFASSYFYHFLVLKSVSSLLPHIIKGHIFIILLHFTTFLQRAGLPEARPTCSRRQGRRPPAAPSTAISKSSVFYDSPVIHRTDR